MLFDDRIVVESPGNLPGIVRLNNMRQVHFSRNPKIAAFLHEYDYVQEFGEGVDRMYKEMEKAGLPAPEILEHLRVSSGLSAKELAALLHKTPRTIQRNINSLKEKGILQREGSDRSGRWIVLK